MYNCNTSLYLFMHEQIQIPEELRVIKQYLFMHGQIQIEEELRVI